MTDRQVDSKVDRRGTVWDWPVGVIVAGVLLLMLIGGSGSTAGILLCLLMIGFGLVTWLARRGAFTARG